MMRKILKVIVGIGFAAVFSVSHADISTMNKYYDKPNLAPKVQRCKGNQDCNVFYALSKQWKSIPNGFHTPGCPECKVKEEAKDGNGYGLNKGYSLKRDYSINLSEAGWNEFYKGGSATKSDERIFGEGLAVLIYLDYKK